MYGSPSELIERQALHSALTVLPHPETQEPLALTAPFHSDMSKLLSAFFGEGTDEMIIGELNGRINEYSGNTRADRAE